ncbi:MAG: hypothetical protein HDR00_01775 [Lachnospiraceae bacterium]|nr:hypothetical protein [Lachnospiraceae bacterium]
MKKYLIYLILCISLLIVSCGRTENNGTTDKAKEQNNALDAVSDNELSRVDEESMIPIIKEKATEIIELHPEETVQPENEENNIEGQKPINPNIEIKGDINWSGEEADKAIEMYQEFIWGEREIDGWDIDELTIPDFSLFKEASIPLTKAGRYATHYALWDTNGDNIPELHFDSARYYLVFSYKDGDVFVWKDLTNGIECIPRKDGGFITWSIRIYKSDYYVYSIYDYSGEEIYCLEFSWDDTNRNGSHDSEDEYLFDNELVSQDAWEELAKKYVYRNENGVWTFANQLDWVVLYEDSYKLPKDIK